MLGLYGYIGLLLHEDCTTMDEMWGSIGVYHLLTFRGISSILNALFDFLHDVLESSHSDSLQKTPTLKPRRLDDNHAACTNLQVRVICATNATRWCSYSFARATGSRALGNCHKLVSLKSALVPDRPHSSELPLNLPGPEWPAPKHYAPMPNPARSTPQAHL